MNAAIELVDVSKRFGAAQGLDRLSLRVETGAIYGFLGPNGAGKTTTLRALLGLVRADSGTVRVLGVDPASDAVRVRRKVGVLLEADGVYERISALANLDYFARIHHLPTGERAPRIEALLRSFDLWERRHEPVARWSKGMRQKLAIARALVHAPELLLLDEPFTGLDPAAAAELRERISRLAQEQRVTVLLTTHDLAHVEKICSAVTVIQNGHAIAAGAPDELGGTSDLVEVEVGGSGLTRALLARLEAAGQIASFVWRDERSSLVRCAAEQRRALGTELVKNGVELQELHTRRGSLEDKFLSLVGASEAGSGDAGKAAGGAS